MALGGADHSEDEGGNNGDEHYLCHGYHYDPQPGISVGVYNEEDDVNDLNGAARRAHGQ